MSKSFPELIQLDYLRDRAAQKRIAGVTLAFAAAAVVYVLFAPKWYRSTVTLAPGKSQRSGGLSTLLGGGDLGALVAGFDVATGGGADVARIAAVLRSNSVSDGVAEKLDLRARYNASSLESAREVLWQHCAVKTIPKPNLVELSCEDRDPKIAQDMLQIFSELGNESFRRANVSSAVEEARYLEKRVEELRRRADESAARLRAFQEEHQIVDLDTQAKAVVSSMATLQAQRIARQMELDYATGFSSRDEAGAQQIESQLAVVERKLRDLEEEGPPPDTAKNTVKMPQKAGRGLFPAALAVPRLRAQYEALYRDRRVAEATLVFALDRLEGAKAAEARDVSTFQVLDPPNLPVRHHKPRKAETVIEVALLGLLVGVALEWWRWRRTARTVA